MLMVSPRPPPPVPAELAGIARAAFTKDQPYLRLANERGGHFTDETSGAFFPARGCPALAS